MSNVAAVSQYQQRRCAHCGKPMKGIEPLDAPARYCGDRCARDAQPDKVIIGAGKGSASG